MARLFYPEAPNGKIILVGVRKSVRILIVRSKKWACVGVANNKTLQRTFELKKEIGGVEVIIFLFSPHSLVRKRVGEDDKTLVNGRFCQVKPR